MGSGSLKARTAVFTFLSRADYLKHAELRGVALRVGVKSIGMHWK